jgi:hypothetical protein
MKTRIFLFLLLFAAGEAAAQTTLQVVTKTVQKTVSWKAGYAVEITCEKADIEVETAPSGQNSVSVKAELSARHPQLDSARYDLDAWKFVTSTVGKKIFVRAYIGLPQGAALPASNLKAKLKVTVPANCPTTLSNKFGSARLENIAAPVTLSGEFCAFTLLQLGGKVQVDSRYGNVEGRQLSGPVEVQAKRADVSLAGLNGDCKVVSEYGSVQLEAAAQTGNVTVQASKGDVTLETPQPFRHNFDLKANYGEVTMPLSLRLDAGASSDKQRASLNQGENRPFILVETTLGNITVK